MYAAPARDSSSCANVFMRKGLDALAGEGQRRMGRDLVRAGGHQGGDRGSSGGAGGQATGTICDDLGADADGPGIVLHGLHLRFLLTY